MFQPSSHSWAVLGSAFEPIRLRFMRAQALGEVLPEHYVFPACEASHFDSMRPMASWRTAWRNLRKAAGLPNLRFHDLRHHAITELAESQASDSTVMAIAGHVSPKMFAHYSHVRLQAKRSALDSISTRRAETVNLGRTRGLRHKARHKRWQGPRASAATD
jgi:integrase